MIKVIIFDFDGTIADSKKIILDILHTVSKIELTPAEVDELKGKRSNEILRQLKIKNGRSHGSFSRCARL